MSIDRGVGHTGVTAGKRGTEIVRARGAEIRQREIVEIQTSDLIDRYLTVAASVTGGDFAFEWRRADDPLESFPPIKRMPNPARVRRKRTRRAGVNTIRICRIDPDRFLEPGSTDAGDDWMTKRRRI